MQGINGWMTSYDHSNYYKSIEKENNDTYD